ncbi:MAG: acylphosphatase [Gammaproteobacteria bacterium]|nr:acylphosphatase [Gammaproteobacteria bacterium]
MDVCKQVFISGRVQGVFFRESTRQKASELKLTGSVRNLRDGRVEVLVAGDDEVVQSLIKWLKIGPKYAKVSTIEVIDFPVDYLQGSQQGYFDVLPTR